MVRAYFRFYAELNDFLPSASRQVSFERNLKERASIKDAIESLGVPHPEVDLILVNGESVDFSYLVQDCDQLYWKGAHYGKIQQFIERVRQSRF